MTHEREYKEGVEERNSCLTDRIFRVLAGGGGGGFMLGLVKEEEGGG